MWFCLSWADPTCSIDLRRSQAKNRLGFAPCDKSRCAAKMMKGPQVPLGVISASRLSLASQSDIREESHGAVQLRIEMWIGSGPEPVTSNGDSGLVMLVVRHGSMACRYITGLNRVCFSIPLRWLCNNLPTISIFEVFDTPSVSYCTETWTFRGVV